MSTYVFSDIHGHVAPLRRLVERLKPTDDDRFICLGDMIDRGPDPVGVIRFVRSLPNVEVILGNHEDLMLQAIDFSDDDAMALFNWGINGGATTKAGLDLLDSEELEDLLAWVRSLKRWGYVRVGGRLFLLAHAGLELGAPVPDEWTDEAAEAYLKAQSGDDLTWIREEFWGAEKGLSGEDGEGPIVVCGHTPTPYLDMMTTALDRPALNEDGRAQMVRVGADRDRWDIDAGAAGGSSFGQVLILRLDDEQEFYEPIRDGE